MPLQPNCNVVCWKQGHFEMPKPIKTLKGQSLFFLINLHTKAQRNIWSLWSISLHFSSFLLFSRWQKNKEKAWILFQREALFFLLEQRKTRLHFYWFMIMGTAFTGISSDALQTLFTMMLWGLLLKALPATVFVLYPLDLTRPAGSIIHSHQRSISQLINSVFCPVF